MECFICKREFVSKYYKQQFCSKKCANNRERKPRKEKILRTGYWYILVKGHHSNTKQHYVAEHRLVMEKHLGRPLLPQEAVHHIDHDKLNNDIANLQLFATRGQHTKIGHPEIHERLQKLFKGKRFSPSTEFKKGHTNNLGEKLSKRHIESLKRAWTGRKRSKQDALGRFV